MISTAIAFRADGHPVSYREALLAASVSGTLSRLAAIQAVCARTPHLKVSRGGMKMGWRTVAQAELMLASFGLQADAVAQALLYEDEVTGAPPETDRQVETIVARLAAASLLKEVLMIVASRWAVWPCFSPDKERFRRHLATLEGERHRSLDDAASQAVIAREAAFRSFREPHGESTRRVFDANPAAFGIVHFEERPSGQSEAGWMPGRAIVCELLRDRVWRDLAVMPLMVAIGPRTGRDGEPVMRRVTARRPPSFDDRVVRHACEEIALADRLRPLLRRRIDFRPRP